MVGTPEPLERYEKLVLLLEVESPFNTPTLPYQTHTSQQSDPGRYNLRVLRPLIPSSPTIEL